MLLSFVAQSGSHIMHIAHEQGHTIFLRLSKNTLYTIIVLQNYTKKPHQNTSGEKLAYLLLYLVTTNLSQIKNIMEVNPAREHSPYPSNCVPTKNWVCALSATIAKSRHAGVEGIAYSIYCISTLFTLE